jgi:hypothetical protein
MVTPQALLPTRKVVDRYIGRVSFLFAIRGNVGLICDSI